MTNNALIATAQHIEKRVVEQHRPQLVFLERGPALVRKPIAISWRYFCNRKSCYGHWFVISGKFENASAQEDGTIAFKLADVVRHLSVEKKGLGGRPCSTKIRRNPLTNIEEISFKVTKDSACYSTSTDPLTGVHIRSRQLWVQMSFSDNVDAVMW